MSILVQAPELHKLSIDEYHRLVACGGLADAQSVRLGPLSLDDLFAAALPAQQ